MVSIIKHFLFYRSHGIHRFTATLSVFNLQVDTYNVRLDFSSLLPGNAEEGLLDTFGRFGRAGEARIAWARMIA